MGQKKKVFRHRRVIKRGLLNEPTIFKFIVIILCVFILGTCFLIQNIPGFKTSKVFEQGKHRGHNIGNYISLLKVSNHDNISSIAKDTGKETVNIVSSINSPPSPITNEKEAINFLVDEPISNFPLEHLGSSTIADKKSYKKGGMRFSEWKDGDTPYTITNKLQQKSDEIAYERKKYVKAAMVHAWNGYRDHAFGFDEVKPVTGGTTTHWGGLGTTLIDALDTLWLMDMKDEFWEARDWVRDSLDQNVDVDASVFETTIRSLGGLLGAYSFSRDKTFLLKAMDIGERLFKAFSDETSVVPHELVNLKTGRGSNAKWVGSRYIISEIGSIQMEFRDLSWSTGVKEYAQKSERVFEALKKIEPKDGLYPYFLTSLNGELHFASNDVSFGAFGDSFFEYELKLWLQGGRKESMYREMYDKSMDGMHKQLLHVSQNGLWYIGTRMDTIKFDHLTCFMGGLLALGAYTDPEGLDSSRAQRDLRTAKQLAYTCYQMYAQMPTGLAPDVIKFSKSNGFSIVEGNYGLRPETVETLFILNKLTGDPIYRTWGWEIFESIEQYCKTAIAYGKHPNVKNINVSPEDMMESFFMGETLKYLYLLFDPDTEVDILNKHVFNTEAHPLLNKDHYPTDNVFN
mmetsp:Transcript_1179/g.1434  ORF Transcript_1179/g.1434 Transcript_1179/m.1434 type:complete len:628 (+) Transcript_1179:65-1948(+)